MRKGTSLAYALKDAAHPAGRSLEDGRCKSSYANVPESSRSSPSVVRNRQNMNGCNVLFVCRDNSAWSIITFAAPFFCANDVGKWWKVTRFMLGTERTSQRAVAA